MHKGPLTKILGNHIVNSAEQPCLHQPNHIETGLTKLKLSEYKPINTPIAPGIALKPATDDDAYDFSNLNINYCSSMGYLNFIATRNQPDLSYPVSSLSRFNANPDLSHWMEAKHAWRHVKTTQNLALCLKKNSFKFDLESWSDTDGGNDPISRRSHTGYLILLYGCAVSWQSKLQPTVLLSSTKGELKSLVLATQEKIWILNLLKELNPSLSLTHCSHIDNKALNNLINFESHHSALKHVNIQIKWL